MNKKLLLLPLLFLSLIGCGQVDDSKTQLTYGTLIQKEAIHITPTEFDTKVTNRENILLTIYPKDSTCGCWRTFSYIINKAVNDEHLKIYTYYVHDIDESATMKEIGGFYRLDNAPTFYIIRDGKLVKGYNHSSSNPFYDKYESFLAEIDARCYRPKIMEIDEDYYQRLNKNNKVIFFARGTCSDCTYAIPNVLVPYYYNHQDKDYIYYFDLDSYKNSDVNLYQEKKDEFLLSTKNNPKLGFVNGVVPTFQYYKDDELYDMSVYFNDGELTYNKEKDVYYALETYYTSPRLENLHYLDNYAYRDLAKVEIKKEEVTSYVTSYYWKNAYAAKYHNEILTCFLETYLSSK